MHLTVNLTSLAVILWSGMLIIAGSIWILSSQVRRLADLIEQAKAVEPEVSPGSSPRLHASREVALRLVDRPKSRAN